MKTSGGLLPLLPRFAAVGMQLITSADTPVERSMVSVVIGRSPAVDSIFDAPPLLIPPKISRKALSWEVAEGRLLFTFLEDKEDLDNLGSCLGESGGGKLSMTSKIPARTTIKNNIKHRRGGWQPQELMVAF
mmetsp:Transcript_9339/g.20000  ORF Transcript_9339/g.20000 Transcript_9339/m.20000 type:complete len:132 (+) Transcript_9339:884-1279(+)